MQDNNGAAALFCIFYFPLQKIYCLLTDYSKFRHYCNFQITLKTTLVLLILYRIANG